MPRALVQSDQFASMVAISPAINWARQGRYMTRHRLRLEGYDETAIEQAIAFDARVMKLIDEDGSYDAYTDLMRERPPSSAGVMSADRWQFVKLNAASDAQENLAQIRVPVLALFGDKDVNVDFQESANVYAEILSQDVTIKIFPNADHALLPTNEARLVFGDDSMIWRLIQIDLEGEDAFVPGLFQALSAWLEINVHSV